MNSMNNYCLKWEDYTKFEDGRIRIFHRDKPGPGGYAARNLGILNSRAEWVVFLDADDEWKDDYLYNMYNLSKAHPQARVLSCSWITKDGDKEYLDSFTSNNLSDVVTLDFERFLCAEIKLMRPICTSVACIRKGIIIKAGLFPDGIIKMGGDVDTWLRCVYEANGIVWSRFVGAIYYRDSVSMVTKNSLVSPELHVCTTNKLINEICSDKVKRLLKIRCNNLVVTAWNNNAQKGNYRIFNLTKLLYKDTLNTKTALHILLFYMPDFILPYVYKLLFRFVSIKRSLMKMSL